jgi:uncharacterized BrkB/YihY/UPF0761 family membrane protein
MEERPPSNPFRMVPFTVHATRGLLRDQRSRRVMMTISLIVTLVLVVVGFSGLRSWLDPHEHPWRFTFYWLICGWQTLLVLLLALLDILLVREQARAARKALLEEAQRKDASGE